ncbi:IgGFc-binding protein [Nannocystaceae bacterium ST9]
MKLARSTRLLLIPSLALACADPTRTNADDGVSADSLEGITVDGDGDGDPTGDGEGDSSTGDGDGDASTGDGDGDGNDGPKFDFAIPDTNEPPQGPIIPETCVQAEAGASTVGCLFFGADLDSHDAAEDQQYAIAVSNVQQDDAANVQIEQKQNGAWTVIAGPTPVAPLSLYTFNLPSFNQDDSGIKTGGAYRVSSDVPIIAYQFNPVDGSASYLSDASMLYPVATWDHFNQVVGWKVIDDGFGPQGAYISIIAAHDGTQVTVTPSTSTLAGAGVPAGQAGVPFVIDLNEGDLAEVMTKTMNQGLTGTRVETDDDHPVAVFSGNECTFIPTEVYACDHLEEQLAGVRLWGQHFIGSRVPPRSANDPSLWQIYASEDATSITLTADAQVTGLPASPFMLNAGQVVEFYAGGNANQPGDFEVEADKPIAVLNYMTGSENPGAGIGDPAMVQLSPIEQFLPRYVVLVPSTWITDVAVVARPAGAEILLDGVAIADNLFIPVANSGYEVARVPVADGIHVFDGDTNAFSIVILGYDDFDSYAYLGGTGTGVINPNPQG